MSFAVRILLPALLLCILAACGSDGGQLQSDGDSAEVDYENPAADGDAEFADGDEDELPGAELEIFPYVNLYASHTQTDVLPWPRESFDAVATLRDDDTATSWKAPGDGESYIDLDLMPWLGRAVSLYRLSIDMAGADGGKAPAVKAQFFNACGGRLLHEQDFTDTASVLELGERKAGCLRLLFSPADGNAFEVRSISLLSRDAAISLPENKPAAQAIRHPSYGVIEGFYGVPWSWDERRRMLDSLAARGLGAYLYCPKNDELHRARWREAYPQSFMEQFAALNEYARQRGQTLYFGLSPFIDYNFDEVDYTALEEKLAAFTAMGITGVAILADDIEFDISEAVDGELGARHVAEVNRLLDDLRAESPDLQMLFVPTVYSDERADDWPGGLDYLAALGGLDESISVMWTGTGTSSATMRASDMQRITDTLGRAPLIWENYYANDGGDGFTGRILLAPYQGREATLQGAVEGIMQNPMIQGALARAALGNFAYWVENPQSGGAQYGAESLYSSISVELGHAYGAAFDAERSAAALELFMQTWDGHAQRFPALARMDELIAGVIEKINAQTFLPNDEEARELMQIFARLSIAENLLYHSGLSRDMSDEMYWPSCAMQHVGRQGLYIMQALGARLANSDGLAAFIEAAAGEKSAAARCRFQFSRDQVNSLGDTMEKMPAQSADFSAPQITPSESSCIAGERWFSGAAAEGVVTLAVGLPGARVEDGAVVFDPPYAGSFSYARLLFADKGWNVESGALLCDTP